MKTKKALLVAVLSLPLLAACKKTSTFKITFHQDEGNKDDVIEVVVGKTTAEDVKTFQNNITLNQKDYYTVKWADYDFSKITSDYVVNAIYTPIDYTITFKNGSDVVGAVTYTVESKEEEVKAKEPAVPTKQGYTYKWEDYTIKGKHENFEVKAIESINEYTITYKNGETVLGTTKYTCVMTDAQVKAKEPTLPSPTKQGYSFKYEDYSIVGKYADFTVKAVESANTYYATFVDKDGEQVGDKVPFTVETTEIEEPDVPERAHYTGEWEDYELGASDITIKPVYTVITYTATFQDGETKEEKTFDIENPKITTPTISAETGYKTIDWKLGDKHYAGGVEIDMSNNLADVTFTKYREGNEYTITLNKNGGILDATEVKIKYGASYELPTPIFKSNDKEIATFLGWFDSNGNQVPTKGDSFPLLGDQTLIARYYANFEIADGIDAVILTGSRGVTIKSKELTGEDKTEGSKSIKLTSKGQDEEGSSKTIGCSFDANFVTSAFNDPTVNAILFDLKASASLTKLSVQNSITSCYEYNCCSNDQPGFGGQTCWKTFALTREMYNAATDKTLLICTVGDQLPYGGNIWIDNIRPSTTSVNLLGFEGGRIVPKDDTSPHYKKSVSFRDFSNAELFTITTGYADAINFGFDYQYKSEGLRSIHYEHKPNTNVWLTLSQLDKSKVKEVSFDICLSKAYNGNTVRDGKGAELFPSSKVYQAYEWVTFTIPVAQISDAKQFCTITSSVECDFYIDNIKIVLNE